VHLSLQTWYASPSLHLGSGATKFGFPQELLGLLEARLVELEAVLVALPDA
jgi:hypothetical protein